MFDEALKALKWRVGDNGDQPGVYGGIFKYNRPIKPMCQLWGEFIEIYVKADVEGEFTIKNKVQKKGG